jgi:hypothetical protein
MTNDTDSIYTFLRDEGLTYRDTVIELAHMIARHVEYGTSDSMARASELTNSLQRLLDLDN